jgi:hypothetical protein
VPDELLGKKVKCPGCKGTFTAEDPDAVVDVDVIEDEETPHRPKRDTKPRRREDEAIEEEDRPVRRRRSREEIQDDEDYRDEEDDLEDERTRRRRKRSTAKRRAAEALAAPAMALIVTGVLGLALFIVDIVLRIALGSAITAGLLGKGNAAAEAKANEMLYGIIVDLVFMIFPGIVITGAFKLKNVSSYGYGLTAAIMAMLPCGGCCLLGLPIGIWALVVMNRAEVKRAFG